MAVSIKCNYSRCAIPSLCQRIIGNSRRRLSQSELTGVIDEYNKKFESEAMHLDSSVGYKRIPRLLLTFTRKWHPQSQKDTFLRVFSLSAWSHLPADEKCKHSLSNCQECDRQHLSLTRAFPDRSSRTKQLTNKQPAVVFSKHDLSSPTKCGRKVQ